MSAPRKQKGRCSCGGRLDEMLRCTVCGAAARGAKRTGRPSITIHLDESALCRPEVGRLVKALIRAIGGAEAGEGE